MYVANSKKRDSKKHRDLSRLKTKNPARGWVFAILKRNKLTF